MCCTTSSWLSFCATRNTPWLLITDLSWAYDNVDRQFLLGYRLSEAYRHQGEWSGALGRTAAQRQQRQGSDKRHVTRPFLIITGLTQGSPISTSHITLSKL